MCALYNQRKQRLTPPHFFGLYCLLSLCYFVIFLFFISKGRMGESTSFNSFAGRVIMTPMMLKFYRGPHECVPCGCAHLYKFYVCCRVFRSLPSIVQNVVLSPSSPSGNTPVLFPPLIRFCITPMLPNLIVVLNWWWYVIFSYRLLFIVSRVLRCRIVQLKGHACVPPFPRHFSFFTHTLLYSEHERFVCVCGCVCARLLLKP